ILVGIGVFIVAGFYIRTVKGKGSFSTIFALFRLHKIKRIKHWIKLIKDIEKKTQYFFKYHKHYFFKSYFYYVITAAFLLLQIKFLLLSIGVDFNFPQIVLIITMWGLLNFVPTPASLGFLEAGQSGLFHFLQGNSAIGLAMTLLLRSAYLVMVLLGFIFISQFSGKQIWKKI
ncbi:MAG: flippase-like domain-containing protein, partial [Nanoarchaeota archaeon]|nr:flippase-like domain-containing protein [Nanoarchaeota archaeon]